MGGWLCRTALLALAILLGLPVLAGSLGVEPALAGTGSPTAASARGGEVLELRRGQVLETLSFVTVDRTARERTLARPPDGLRDWYGSGYRLVSEQTCGLRVCVHWVAATRDAPPLADADGNGLPDWVELALATLEDAWLTYHEVFGYRETLADDNDPDELDGRLDVFLADIGADGLYGYAATDDPNLFQFYPFFNFSAYIVLDNDFAPEQFDEGASGVDALRIAAVHELYHAFEFAYDAAADTWFMQASASWAEDELVDDVDINRVWLPYSALGRPDVPLDFGEGPFQYANWIFLRYVSERFGRDIIRDSWALADGSPEGLDLYSVKALKKAVRARGGRWTQVFADFGVANRVPEKVYEEGAYYPRAPLTATYRLRSGGGLAGWTRAPLDHLTNRYFGFVPGSGVSPEATLRVDVRIPKRAWGRAALIVHTTDGEARVWRIGVDRKGRGWRSVPFGRDEVTGVDLVLTNASVAYKCWEFIDLVDGEIVELPFACFGKPLHDGLEYRFKAHLDG